MILYILHNPNPRRRHQPLLVNYQVGTCATLRNAAGFGGEGARRKRFPLFFVVEFGAIKTTRQRTVPVITMDSDKKKKIRGPPMLGYIILLFIVFANLQSTPCAATGCLFAWFNISFLINPPLFYPKQGFRYDACQRRKNIRRLSSRANVLRMCHWAIHRVLLY